MGGFLRACALFAIALASPEQALAHASDSGIKLLLPTAYYLAGGTLAVAATVLVAALMPAKWATALFRPRLPWRGPLPRIETVTSLLGAAVLAALLWAGFTGTPDPLENPLPLAVWTLWWVGLTLACALLGNLWALVNPWAGVFALIGEEGLTRLPERIGLAPAILSFLGFAWFELVSLSPEDPEWLARVVTAYVLVTFAMGALFGWRDWSRRGECFSVFFRFIARLAPVQFEREGGTVTMRAGFPGFGVLHGRPIGADGALFILLALATVSFDGLSRTFAWLDLIGVNPLAFPGRSAVATANGLGLVGAWAVLAGAFFLCLAAGRAGAQAGRLALTILPISLVYHFAHYLTVLLVNGQYARAAGQRMLGWPETPVTTSFLNTVEGVNRIWQAQSGAIVLGHVLAVLLAHAAMLETTRTGREAALKGLPLALLMIVYTAFGLWLLAAPTGA